MAYMKAGWRADEKEYLTGILLECQKVGKRADKMAGQLVVQMAERKVEKKVESWAVQRGHQKDNWTGCCWVQQMADSKAEPMADSMVGWTADQMAVLKV